MCRANKFQIKKFLIFWSEWYIKWSHIQEQVTCILFSSLFQIKICDPKFKFRFLSSNKFKSNRPQTHLKLKFGHIPNLIARFRTLDYPRLLSLNQIKLWISSQVHLELKFGKISNFKLGFNLNLCLKSTSKFNVEFLKIKALT